MRVEKGDDARGKLPSKYYKPTEPPTLVSVTYCVEKFKFQLSK